MSLLPHATSWARLLLLAVLLVLSRADAWAQGTEEDPELPNIAPREVEIRGQLEFSFPSLERQPLVGFNPPPRISEVAPDRRPYIETYKQQAAALPVGMSDLERREAQPFVQQNPSDILFEASAGRYLSRRVLGHGYVPLTTHEYVNARFDYAGTDGHTPFEDEPDAESTADAIEGALRLGTQRGGVAAHLEGGGFYEEYLLYGLEQSPTELAIDPLPARTAQGGYVDLQVGTQPGADLEITSSFRYSGVDYDTGVFEQERPSTSRSEQRLDAGLQLILPAPSVDLILDAAVSSAGLNGNAFAEGDLSAINVGALVRLNTGRTWHVTAGGRILTYKTSAVAGLEGEEGYVSPAFKLDLYPSSRLQLYVHHLPGIDFNGLRDLHRENPYLTVEPPQLSSTPLLLMQPTVRLIDLEAGARLYVGTTRLSVFGRFEQQPNRLFFEAQPRVISGYRRGFFTTDYAEARIYTVGGEATFMLPGQLHATLGATGRYGRLTDEDVAIPYFAPLTGRLTFSYAFAGTKGLLQLTGRFESPRYVDRTETREAPAYFDADLLASYRILQPLALVVRLENMIPGGPERWERYAQPPFVGLVGLRLHW